jgi:imidazoleglycerol-phosphate dehydratase
MDEALVLAAIDISGRGGLYYDVAFPTEKIGTFDTELVEEFMHSLAANAGITLHLRMLAGRNSHHIAEACFKGLARVLREAVSTDERFADRIPSTKGVL